MTDDRYSARLGAPATVAALVVFLTLAVGVVAAGPIVGSGTTFEASSSGPTITITEQLELDDSQRFPDGNTVDLPPHAIFNSSGDTTATVDQITGTWTNVSTTDVANGLEVNPSDKQSVTVEGSSVSAINISSVDETRNSVDIIYDASASVTLTVTNLPADTTVDAIDITTADRLDRQTTDGSGTATFTLESGTHDVTLREVSSGGGDGRGSYTGGDDSNVVNDADDQDGEETADDEGDGEDESTQAELKIIVEEDTTREGEDNETSGETSDETDGQEQEDETDGDESEGDSGDDGTDGDGSSEPDRLAVTIQGASEGSTATIDDRATGGSSVGSTKNVAVESVSMQMARGRDRASLSITTYEHDVVDSDSADSATVTTAARLFEESTNSVAAGYVEVEHDFESADLSGVSFQYTARKSYLAELGVAPEDVQLYHNSDGDSWTPVETRHVGDNETHHRFESEAPGFSVFAIGTGAEPLALTGAELGSETITVGDQVRVTARVENRGSVVHEREVTLTADGNTVASDTLQVDGGQSQSVDLAFEPDDAGEYDLAADGAFVGTLTVQQSADTIENTETTTGEDDGEDDDGSLWLVGLFLVVIVGGVLAVVGYRCRGGDDQPAGQLR